MILPTIMAALADNLPPEKVGKAQAVLALDRDNQDALTFIEASDFAIRNKGALDTP